MAKKKKQFHNISITPKAGTHYEVHHSPVMEPSDSKEPMAAPMGDDQKNEKLFSHGERADLHKHIDNLMDAHEGTGGGEHEEPDADDMPKPPQNHPMQKLRKKW